MSKEIILELAQKPLSDFLLEKSKDQIREVTKSFEVFLFLMKKNRVEDLEILIDLSLLDLGFHGANALSQRVSPNDFSELEELEEIEEAIMQRNNPAPLEMKEVIFLWATINSYNRICNMLVQYVAMPNFFADDVFIDDQNVSPKLNNQTKRLIEELEEGKSLIDVTSSFSVLKKKHALFVPHKFAAFMKWVQENKRFELAREFAQMQRKLVSEAHIIAANELALNNISVIIHKTSLDFNLPFAQLIKENGTWAIEDLAFNGSVDDIKNILDKSEASETKLILNFAAKRGHENIFKIFFDKVKSEESFEATAWHDWYGIAREAVLNNQNEVLKIILNAAKEKIIPQRIYAQSLTFVTPAALAGNQETVLTLLEVAKDLEISKEVLTANDAALKKLQLQKKDSGIELEEVKQPSVVPYPNGFAQVINNIRQFLKI